MGKPNYSFQKRQREIAKQKKKEEKRLQKLAKKNAAGEDVDDSFCLRHEVPLPASLSSRPRAAIVETRVGRRDTLRMARLPRDVVIHPRQGTRGAPGWTTQWGS